MELQLRMLLLLYGHSNPAEAHDAPDPVMQLSSVGVWPPVMALLKRSASLTMFWPTPGLMRLYISPHGSNASYSGVMWARLMEVAIGWSWSYWQSEALCERAWR
jgi:hypothetical protein